MKLCWDNINRLGPISRGGVLYINTTQYVLRDSCKNCGEEYLAKKRGSKVSKFCSLKCSHSGEFHPQFGIPKPERLREKWSVTRTGMYSGNKNPMYGKRMELAPNWKGGDVKEDRPEKKLYEYKAFRESVFKRDNFTCAMCKKRGGYKEAHHIYPYRDYPQYVYNVWNGITLCVLCHRRIKNREFEFMEDFMLFTTGGLNSEVRHGSVG